jgi:site-specific recombinase XerD
MHSAHTADNVSVMGAQPTTSKARRSRRSAVPDTSEAAAIGRSWERHLRAAGRSPRTIDSYLESLRNYVAWAAESGRSTNPLDLTKADVESWVVWLLDTRSAATARLRLASLKQFTRWATAEGELDADPLLGMTPPAQPEREVPVIAEADLDRLLRSLAGSEFVDRRDLAIIWVLMTTGIRAGELVGMTVDDIDLDARTITVTGKGNRARTVAVADQTVLALDRYDRARGRHPRANLPAFWIGNRGRLTDSGLRQLVQRRGEAVGIDDLHPHRFRHTFAHRWLSKGGTEGGLQAAAGWRSPQMLARYGASARSERAREEAARLGLEDL